MGKIELWILDLALNLDVLYHYVKFKQIISKGFQGLLRTRQRTDRRTDGQGGYNMLFFRGA
jgi:hypothetical protein